MHDIIVHFGAPKTGSSAIQFFLLQNRNTLEEYGFFYPEHPVDRNSISGGHFQYSRLLRQGDYGSAKRLLSENLEIAKAKRCTLLISAESLAGQAAGFQKISDEFSVRAIGFYRDPMELLLSSYNQQVKRSFLTKNLVEYCGEVAQRSDSNFGGEVHQEWREIYGLDTSILLYDQKNFDARRIEHCFLSSIGIKDENFSKFVYPDRKINLSYTQSALRLKRLLNYFIGKKPAIDNEIDKSLQAFSDRNSEAAFSLASLLPADVWQKVSIRFGEQRTVDWKRFFPEFDPPSLASKDAAQMDICWTGKYSLSYIALQAFRDQPSICEYIKECLLQSSEDESAEEARARLELAELMGLSIDNSVSDSNVFFNEEQLNRVLGENLGAPGLLRELALAYERKGNYGTARRLIARAREIRPGAEALVRIEARIEKRMNKH